MITSILKNFNFKYRTIDFVREKESHGDLDILVEIDNKENINKFYQHLIDHEILCEKTSTTSISILLLTFQFDIIFIEKECIEYAYNYFSWNDLGNLIGKLSRKLGLKHGFTGLTYLQYGENDTHLLHEHIVSLDYNVILNLLELDIEHFKKGFDTYFEMFEWLSKSPYFDPNLYNYSSLNNKNRVRDHKRKIYRLFLEWLEDKEFSEPIRIHDQTQYVLDSFPEILQEYNLANERFNKNLLLKEKFNGLLIAQWTGLLRTELSAFINEFLKVNPKDTLYNLTEDQIKQTVLQFYSKYKIT